MTFLNPLLMWGAAFAAIPILIHLFNRRRYRRLQWAGMEVSALLGRMLGRVRRVAGCVR